MSYPEPSTLVNDRGPFKADDIELPSPVKIKPFTRTGTSLSQAETVTENSPISPVKDKGSSSLSKAETWEPKVGISPTSTFQLPEILSVDKEALHGYPKLSTHMGKIEGQAIYRRFASLNARRLLYRQAEIVCLEHELNALEQQFAEHKHLHYSVRELKDAEPGTIGAQLWDKIQELNAALEHYNKCLLEQQRICKLPEPDDRAVNDLYCFVHNDNRGGRWLKHPEDTIWEVDDSFKKMQEDLVSLNMGQEESDLFTKVMNGRVFDLFHKMYTIFKAPDDENGKYEYDDTNIRRVINAVNIAISSALPALSIIALYYIPSNVWRLVFIVLFSVAFTAAIAFFTSATRAEIFLASVALAGVQAVFVGTNVGSGTYAR